MSLLLLGVWLRDAERVGGELISAVYQSSFGWWEAIHREMDIMIINIIKLEYYHI
jgi:hypothetical protein